MDALISTKEAARQLGLSPITLYAQRSAIRKALRPCKLGGRVMYVQADINILIEKLQQGVPLDQVWDKKEMGDDGAKV